MSSLTPLARVQRTKNLNKRRGYPTCEHGGLLKLASTRVALPVPRQEHPGTWWMGLDSLAQPASAAALTAALPCRQGKAEGGRVFTSRPSCSRELVSAL